MITGISSTPLRLGGPLSTMAAPLPAAPQDTYCGPSRASRQAGAVVGAVGGLWMGATIGVAVGILIMPIGALVGACAGTNAGHALGGVEGFGTVAQIGLGTALGAAAGAYLGGAAPLPFAALGSWVGYNVGWKVARYTALRRFAGSRAEYKRLKPIAKQLWKGSGTLDPSLQALSVIRRPIGNESEAQRLQLLQALHEALPPSRQEIVVGGDFNRLLGAVNNYRKLVRLQLQGETCDALSQRVTTLSDALRAQDQQARLVEVFEKLHQHDRDGSLQPLSSEDVTLSMGQTLLVNADVDAAVRVTLQEAARRRNGGTLAGTPASTVKVDAENGVVHIDGLRLPRSASRQGGTTAVAER